MVGDGEALLDPYRLEQFKIVSNHSFREPSKKINSGADLAFFLNSYAYRDLRIWIQQLAKSSFPTQDIDGVVQSHELHQPILFPPIVISLQRLLQQIEGYMSEAPPDTGPRRFGNVAFRKWYSLLESKVDDLLRESLTLLAFEASGGIATGNDELQSELKSYLLGSFGSPQRLDYGTGHELAFLAFLGGFWKLNAFEDGEEWSIIAGVIQPYLEVVRKLIKIYTLEPAGSHGVWGLDDHCFLPYILGSAQFGTPIPPRTLPRPIRPLPTEGSAKTAPDPASITNRTTVNEWKSKNFYFAAIAFIYDVKKGPFFEHSPYLYNISGIKDGWSKINKGMLKMYDAEVLAKFPVVQHFPFGSLWRWEEDPAAAKVSMSSVHIDNQPTSAAMMNSGTQASWAKHQESALPPMASTRVPWSTNSIDQHSGRYGTSTRHPPPSGRQG